MTRSSHLVKMQARKEEWFFEFLTAGVKPL